MFYRLCYDGKYEKALRPFVREIENFCCESEFQFLSHNELYWKIPCEENFSFCEFYFVNKKVPVFNRQVWDRAMRISDTDGIFQIPVTISKCGEQHYYTIAVPSRIDCFDEKGRILSDSIGRYHIFKSSNRNDKSVYLSETLMNELKIFTGLKFEGVV